MSEILVTQKDGTYISIPLTVTVSGKGTVSYPNETKEPEDTGGDNG